MEVALTVKVTYNREKDGTLADFRVKWLKMQEHFARMQAQGLLPMGQILWSFKTTPRPEPPSPKGAVVRQFRPVHGTYVPILLHQRGTRLDVERIAL